MKKTNVALPFFAARVAKFLPVLLCFIFLGSSDLVAQNYMSLEDAQASVKEALEQVEDNVIAFNVNASAVTNDDQVNVQKQRIYKDFLKISTTTHSVEGTVAEMEESLGWQKYNEPYKSVLRSAVEDLFELITE